MNRVAVSVVNQDIVSVSHTPLCATYLHLSSPASEQCTHVNRCHCHHSYHLKQRQNLQPSISLTPQLPALLLLTLVYLTTFLLCLTLRHSLHHILGKVGTTLVIFWCSQLYLVQGE
ncbi:hypothetical protein EB796_021331 [Bugula neritina]|uniref:Uncharacterized protein n=1 Tax=Bugula neritina TaxID=10212 RepID=A0A7J7J2H7_BUGNE|nr:hypothetical protein EB796_021331 [Bugula neritina]